MNDAGDICNFVIGALFGFVVGMVCMAYNWNDTLAWWKDRLESELKRK